MNILIYSRVFLPSFGGLEKMMDLIADHLAVNGNQVTLITETQSRTALKKPYRIIRSAGLLESLKLARQADVCLVANISLRLTPLLILSGVKPITIHHGWYNSQTQGRTRSVLKNAFAKLTPNIFCSRRVKDAIDAKGVVIPNAYDDSIFFPDPEIVKDLDIVFVGRLVSDKGCDVLLRALSILRERDIHPSLTIVGDGVERNPLQEQAYALGLDDRVRFTGKLEGQKLASEIRRHKIMAVPSCWEEPFGIVALEGAACGCAIVGTDGGGLPEAIGPAGIIVERRNVRAFADGLQRMLQDQGLLQQCLEAAPAHLEKHTREIICGRYTTLLANAANER